MNQRAVSAPYLSMMAPGSTVLRFDFDIASTRPMVTGAFAPFTTALRRAVRRQAELDLLRIEPAALRVLVALMRHHALGEEPGEGLRQAQMPGVAHARG